MAMNRFYLTTAIVTAAMLGAPAFAQSSGNQSANDQQSIERELQIHAMSQQELRKNLEEAGFTNIRIVDAAYMVQAQNEQGDPVILLLNPPETVTQASGNASSDQQRTGTQQQAAASGGGQQQSGSQGGSSLASSYRSFSEAGLDSSRTVVGDMSADELMDNDVVDGSGNQLGTILDLLVGQSDQVQAALIETADGKHVAVSVDRLEVEQGDGGQVLVDLSKSELQQQPAYEQQDGQWQRSSS